MPRAASRLASLLNRDLSRRALLRSVLLGTGALSLPAVLQLRSVAAATRQRSRSLILLWQDGGPSHFETFDPKPEAPSEYRGELGAIRTSLPGVAYCEILPRLAQLADRTAIIRSLHQPSSDHVVGSHNVLTGWYDQTSGGKSRYPDLASIVSRMRSGVEQADIAIGASTDPRLARGMRGFGRGQDPASGWSELPRYIDVGLGLHRGGPAYLGAVDGPFQIAGDPSKPGFTIQNLEAAVDLDRMRSRHEVLAALDRFGPPSDFVPAGQEPLAATYGFRRQAFELVAGGAAARAFDLSRERIEVRERYGLHLAGQQCLLARRLVEAGVSVVAVRFSPDGRGDYDKTMIGWDDHAVHGNIFEIMRQRGPQFDQSVSALIEDLDQSGLADEVLVVVVGEFGRTPRIHVHHGCPGREHWGPAGCALLYGGGLAMGQIVGSTDSKGESPQDRPVTYQDLLATIYHALGINQAHTFVNESGRPVPILPAGQPIAELTGGDRRAAAAERPDRRSMPLGKIAARVERSIVLAPGSTNEDLLAQPNGAACEALRLCDTRVDNRGLAALAEYACLRRLHLNGLAITDEGLAQLAHLTQLEQLILTGTRTTDAGLEHLQRLLRLRRLAIDGTGISLAGVVRLFVERQGRTLIDALAALGLATCDDQGRVVAIQVAGSSFDDEQLQHLAATPSLRELHLAATQVTDRGLAAMGVQANLERLFLAKCAITDAGLKTLGRLPHLRVLNLVGTQITSEGLAALAELKELRSLLITDLKLTRSAVDRLKAQLPQLKVSDFTSV